SIARISAEALRILISMSGIMLNFDSTSAFGRADLLDLGNPFDVLDLEMTAALENFQRVLFVSEPQALGFLNPERRDAGRGVAPGPAMRGLPVEVISDSARAPFRNVRVVQRRPA